MNRDTARFLEVAIQDGLLREDEALYLLLDVGLKAKLADIIQECRARYAARLEAFNKGSVLSFAEHRNSMLIHAPAGVQQSVEYRKQSKTAPDLKSTGNLDNMVSIVRASFCPAVAQAAAHVGHLLSKVTPCQFQVCLCALAASGLDVSSVPALSSTDIDPSR